MLCLYFAEKKQRDNHCHLIQLGKLGDWKSPSVIQWPAPVGGLGAKSPRSWSFLHICT